eukprot:TRINITY_DN15374_c0_g1_i1.p1 TRINITY_DN15374_c0_g1~~TRINITY_DN15374_c0_g1_i1.p1  ORF type:complete len:217 (+),score=87.30 TRINITY_DN15374_c0_g1_i1:61-711(+)
MTRAGRGGAVFRPPAAASSVSVIDAGAFEWRRRMGVHMAYHTSQVNEALHKLLIPVQVFAILRVLSAVVLFEARAGLPVDLAVVFIVATAPLYLCADVAAGALYVVMQVLLWMDRGAVPLYAAPLLFVGALLVQTQIGHRFFEPQGRDDTRDNLAEFGKRGYNPVPLLLVYFYHTVDLLFISGYGAEQLKVVESYKRKHLSTLEKGAQPRKVPARM